MATFNSRKPSFFERLTGGVRVEEDERALAPETPLVVRHGDASQAPPAVEMPEEGELSVDVYQTPDTFVVKAMIAGVKPDDLEVSISRDTVTIRGKRKEEQEISGDGYVYQELYWGAFARSVTLPEEVEPERAEASEKNGLLTIRIPKIDKKKVAKLRVKSS